MYLVFLFSSHVNFMLNSHFFYFLCCFCAITPVGYGSLAVFLTSPLAERLAKAT